MSQQIYEIELNGHQLELSPPEGLARASTEIDLGDGLRLDIRTSTAFALHGSSRAEPGELLRQRVRADDVLEFEYADGSRRWVSVESYREELVDDGALDPASTSGEVFRLPVVSGGAANRGPLYEIAKVLVHGLDTGKVAELAVSKLVACVDRRAKEPGLYRLDAAGALRERVSDHAALRLDSAGGPLLVLIHGTASSTAGAFGELFSGGRWNSLCQSYGSRLFAFEHPTLGVSPVRNAADLAELLPPGARVHLLTHSRGGLVGELLALQQPEGAAVEEFDRAAGEDSEPLRALLDRLAERRPVIERFVRVACPSRGTRLASRRLDWYLSALLHALGLVSGLPDDPVYKTLKGVALELVRRRSEPKEVPGIAAQMPDSPLVRFLNDPRLHSDADLRVVAGKLSTSGTGDLARFLLAQAFFWEDSDGVVDTHAMFGGLRRPTRAHTAHESGLWHCTYFGSDSVLRRITDQLTGTAELAFPRIEQRAACEVPTAPLAPSRGGAHEGGRPIVLVLPDCFGSQLFVGSEARVWLDPEALRLGAHRRLGLDARDVGARPADGSCRDGLIPGGYGALLGHLHETHEARAFAYDWRLSAQANARDLARAITAALDGTEEAVRVLAHGQGGLVVLALAHGHPDLWKRWQQRDGSRAVLLGTPVLGAWATLRLLLGHDPLVQALALLQGGGQADLCAWLSACPGLLEMLPHEAGAPDWFDLATWQPLGIAPPGLAAAGRVARALAREPLGAENIVCVAGQARTTPGPLHRDPKGPRFEALAAGDGRVSHAAARVPGARLFHAEVEHAWLVSDPALFPTLVELLERGRTECLANTAPPAPAGMPKLLARHDEVLYPDLDDLTAYALGGRASGRPRRSLRELAVRVVHGDLRSQKLPLLIGHFEDDALVDAEAAADETLEGRLTDRYRLGVYPGPIGSADVVRATPRNEAGSARRADERAVVVVGLGRVGELTPQKLTLAITDGVLRYAADECERRPDGLRLAALLVGSNSSGLTVEESVMAIVRGVLAANRALRPALSEPHSKARLVGELVFVERYEDRAEVAARAVRDLTRRLGGQLEPDESLRNAPHLEAGGSPAASAPTPSEASAWWRRVLVQDTGTGGLRFVTLTDSARVEGMLSAADRGNIDSFVASLAAKAWDPQSAATLFHMALPNELKARVSTERGLVLVFDRTGATEPVAAEHKSAAAIPWELMGERVARHAQTQPLALRAGLVRQLRVDEPRPAPAPRGTNVLVIGDPQGPYTELPGAQKEAEAVAGQLETEGYNVVRLIRPRPHGAEVFNRLFEREWLMLHVAGHGRKGARSGVPLDNGMMLTAGDIRQLPCAPSLVFINCCYLGTLDKRHHPVLAASLSEQLIREGVRAVVAAGWEVNDQAAITFATTFYREMLSGATFGEALLQARRRTYALHPESNTWGAYQAYGDPGFVLRRRGLPRAPATPPAPVSRREYVQRLADLERGFPADAREARARILDLVGGAASDWRRHADALQKEGDLWRKAGDFERAIDCYRATADNPSGEVSLRALQQLLNLRIRCAADIRDEKRSSFEIRSAFEFLERVVAVQPSSEAWSMVGSACKRLSLVEGDADTVRKRLEQARDAYKTATGRAGGSEALYSGINWLTLRVLLDETPAADIEVIAQQAKQVKGDKLWERLATPDLQLVRFMLADYPPEGVDDLARLYLEARRDASVGDFLSVVEHLAWLLRIESRLRRLPQPAGPAGDASAEQRLRTALSALAELPKRAPKRKPAKLPGARSPRRR